MKLFFYQPGTPKTRNTSSAVMAKFQIPRILTILTKIASVTPHTIDAFIAKLALFAVGGIYDILAVISPIIIVAIPHPTASTRHKTVLAMIGPNSVIGVLTKPLSKIQLWS